MARDASRDPPAGRSRTLRSPRGCTIDESDIRFRIAAARRILYREGCDSQTAGHVSARATGEDAFWVTPFQYFDETLPEHVIKVSFDLEVLEGNWVASPAIEFHAALYRARADVGAVVHHHARYTALVSSTGEVVRPYNLLAYLFYDDQGLIFDDDTGGATEGERIVHAIADKSVLLMHNHGCVVVGPTLEVAAVKSVLLEHAARYHIEAVQVGGKELHDEHRVRRYQAALGQYMVPEMWAAHTRRLRKSDPELFESLVR
jgi:L-fuculose-phosphate aldolase